MKHPPLRGLIAATHTPFDAAGSLNLAAVEPQAGHLLRHRVPVVFIGGTTGEAASLSLEERRSLARRWLEVARGTDLRVIVHVGANCLNDAAVLAREAQDLGAWAIAAVAPSYFKPASVGTLVECCAAIAGAAPETPFYYYDIPSLTGVSLPMPEFLERAATRIPTLAGLKFSNPDLLTFQLCLRAVNGTLDIPWGSDETLLGAIALGARCAVGSSYNFAAPIFHRLLEAVARNDFATAREAQYQAAQLIAACIRAGYLGASKVAMRLLGVDVGPTRLPLANPAPDSVPGIRLALEQAGLLG